MVIRTNNNGNELWREVFVMEDWDRFEADRSWFYGVTTGLDGSIIAAGSAEMIWDGGGTQLDGLIIKLEPLVLEPIIFEWLPEDTVFSVLPGDTITFIARARDQQGDDLFNQWIVNADTMGTDTTETVVFEELGEYYVQCQISDEENTATIGWRVTTEEFYLDHYSPDSLAWTIQRNTEIDFSLGVRAIDGYEARVQLDTH